MDIQDIRNLYQYDSWANHRTLECCAQLTPEQFTRSLGSSFGSVRDTLVHIMGAQWIWLERWHGRTSAGLPAPADFPDFESVKRRWAEVERDLIDYIASLTPEDLQRVLQFKTQAGVPYAQPLWPCLQHVANHSTYHRGQIATMLRQLGTKAVSTDMIVYYRELAAKASA